jgi:vitamin B12 transporter
MVLALVLCSFISQAFAQDELDSIEVATTKDASDFFSGSLEVVTKEDIKQTGYSDITQILSQIPGVTTNNNGGFGSRTSLFIRGAEARHTGFSIDGLRLNDPSNTDRQFDGAFLSPLIFQEVKIYKGPQSIFYGPDAMAGLVEFVTDKGTGKNENEFLVGGGSFDTYRAMVSQSWGTQKHKGKVSASTFKTNGISRLNKKRFDATERDGSITHQVVSSSTHRFEKFNTDLLLGYNFGKSELDDLSRDSKKDQSITHQLFLQQKTSMRLSAKDSLNLRTGVNRYHREIQMSSGDNHYIGNTGQVDLFWDRRTTNLHTLAGISLDQEKFETDRKDRRDNTLFSTYLTQKWTKDIFEFSYGARYDRHQRFGDLITYSLSPAVNFGELRLDYIYATGFKAPSLYQLYAPEMWGAPVGNRKLEAERSYSHSVNASFPLLGGEANISFFENSYDDLITWSMTQGYLNQQKFRVRGVESSWKMGVSKISLRPFLTIQDFRDNETAILRRPRNIWGTDLSYEFNSKISTWARWEYRSASRDFNTTGGITKINSYEKVDMGVTYNLGQQQLALKVMNLFDREYEQLYGFSTQPRSFMIEWGGKI